MDFQTYFSVHKSSQERMVKTPYVDENGIRKGTWSEEEDEKLKAFVNSHGHLNWRQLPKLAGLSRCGKSCRLRWMNYLSPDVKRGNFSQEENDIIIKLHRSLGNRYSFLIEKILNHRFRFSKYIVGHGRWSAIAAQLPGRTDNEVKNHWHSYLKKLTTETLDHSKDSKSRVHCQKTKSSGLEIEGSTSTVGHFVIHGILENSDLSNSTSSLNDSSGSNDEWMGTYSNVTEIDPVMSMFAGENDVFSCKILDGDLWMKPCLVSDSENNLNLSSIMDWEYSNSSLNKYSISNGEFMGNVTEIEPAMSMDKEGNDVFSCEYFYGDRWMKPFLTSNSENISNISSVKDSAYSNSSFKKSSISSDELMGTCSNVTEIDPIVSIFADGNDVSSREILDQNLWMKPFLAPNSENNLNFSSVIDGDGDGEYLIHEQSFVSEEEFSIFLW